jgi:3-dehydroquinate synthase
VFEPLVIQSHRGPYTVVFDDDGLAELNGNLSGQSHFIIDATVAELYENELSHVLNSPSVLQIEANEPSKTLDRFSDYVEHLVVRGVRRGHVLVAIGGGVIQDITCFLAATLLRGLDWHFYPTTLLAQADSCIGSKSSINVGTSKNILGTFTPPARIVINTRVLRTLDQRELRSGIGEMLKVHVIDGPEAFDSIAADYHQLLDDASVMQRYIYRSLLIKKRIIEEDEFDRNVRNVMNYGHSFGHAIESATEFAVPHGIAVTIGMDMANYVSVHLGLMNQSHFARMHPTLRLNYAGFEETEIPLPSLLNALSRDKKNTDSQLGLILPDADARVGRRFISNDARFRSLCEEFLTACRQQ